MDSINEIIINYIHNYIFFIYITIIIKESNVLYSYDTQQLILLFIN